MSVRTFRRILAAALIAALCLFARAEADEADSLWPAAEALEDGALAWVDLDHGAAAFTFTAPSNSVYDICLFPAEPGNFAAKAELWRGATRLAAGEAGVTAVSQRLTAGATYALRVSGHGRAYLEVARHALSRCFAQPMPLDAAGDAYAKAVARPGDAHWYALAPEDGQPVALAGIPDEQGLRLRAQLFGDDGAPLAEARGTTGGACLMDFTPEAGRRYLVRVSAPGGATGLYHLRVERGGDAPPDGLTLSRDALTLNGRESKRLIARPSPAGAGGLIYWESSDPAVAAVDAQGTVEGVAPGTAMVTAYAVGGASARCRVQVRRAAVTGVQLLSNRAALNAGDDAAVEYRVLPENASDPRVTFETDPEGIVEIDSGGVLRGLAPGEATVTVRTLDGGFEASLAVRVSPAPKRWRALLVGEQNYAATVASVRLGSANSVSGIRSMLGELSMDGAKYRVTTLLDASRDGVLAAIAEAFADAQEGDLSLFYITCHGYYADGMTFFQMYDGSVLSAAELAQALQKVPGEIFAIIDCCGSGGVIGRASATADILGGIDAVFAGTPAAPAMGGAKFMVLASAALEQDSYRVGFNAAAAESGMATVLARALCEAGGWQIDGASRGALRADADLDGEVTLRELYDYAAPRVLWLLNAAGGAGYVQSVQVWPEGCGETVFARN